MIVEGSESLKSDVLNMKIPSIKAKMSCNYSINLDRCLRFRVTSSGLLLVYKLFSQLP